MAYYLDINLLPANEINPNFLLSKLYGQLHLLLVQHKTVDGTSKVGFAFPKYSPVKPDDKGKVIRHDENKHPLQYGIGSILRIFAVEQQAIEQLNLKDSLQKSGLLDYLHITGVRPCPQYNKLQQFTRYRYKNGNSIAELTRLARRYAKRHNVSVEQAIAKYANLTTKVVDLPYVTLISSSNDNRKYPMHIKCREHEVDNIEPIFNTFGLAIQGGIPVFN